MDAKLLARLQAASGVGFAIFLVVHLATTISGLFGPESYDATLVGVRTVYRPLLVWEIVLIGGASSMHIVCAVIRIVGRWRARKPASKPPLRIRLHRWSGYVLLAAFGGHVFATRIMPSMTFGDADFAYLAFSVQNWPWFINPYYVVFGAAGALHLGIGLGIAAMILARAKKPVATAFFYAAAALSLVVVAGVISIIIHAPQADTLRFEEFTQAYQQYFPILQP